MPRIPRDRSALWIFSGLTAAGVLLVMLEDGRDRAGVLAAQAGGAVFVPWGALAAARELVVFHQPSLALRVVDGHGARFRGVHRLLRPVQRRRFDIDVAVSATSPFPHQPLAAAIEALRADPALRARLNTHGGAALVSDLVAEASRAGGQPPPSDPGRLA